jgi:hypothetical protein
MAVTASRRASTHFSFSVMAVASIRQVKIISNFPWTKNLGKVPSAKANPILKEEMMVLQQIFLYEKKMAYHFSTSFSTFYTI